MIKEKSLTLDELKSVDINKLVQEINRQSKELLLRNTLKANGFNIELITSNTRFKGIRYWFKCPKCSRKSSKLYLDLNSELVCRVCTGLYYKSQKYNKMIESKI